MSWPKEAFLNLRQILTPKSRPAPGGNLLYTKADNELYLMDSDGTEHVVGGGGIESIVEGDNITVDATDPQNPIVSATLDSAVTLFENGDSITVSVSGTQTATLSYLPLAGSLHVRWGTLMVPIENWSIASNVVTITDPSGVFRTGDEISFAYAHRGFVPSAPVGGAALDFAATGWKWKQIARTDATDYSTAAYDDSAWTTATAAFGDGGDMADASGGPHATLWQKGTRMWARRTLTGMTIGDDMTATIRADDTLTIWLDGTQVYDGHPNGTELTVTIPGSFITATSMKLACRVTDEASSLGCFFDLELVQ